MGDMGGVTSSEYLVPDLTPGHYIVCVQVSHRHTSLQSQCFTVNIHNPVTDNGLGSGVLIIIILGAALVLALFGYFTFTCYIRHTRLARERKLKLKVEEFARKERDRNEKYDKSDVAVTYPDPNEPF